MDFNLEESELSIRTINFLKRCNIFKFSEIIKYDEDSLMQLHFYSPNNVTLCYYLSIKMLDEIKNIIFLNLPFRIDEVGSLTKYNSGGMYIESKHG